METVNQETKDTGAETTGKTFTQEEVNAIVADRLTRERSKYADYDELKAKAGKFDEAAEASKTDLQKLQEAKAEAARLQSQIDTMMKADGIRKIREKVAAETKVPANLLSGEDEASCKAQAEAILAFAQPASYPTLRDGGEVRKTSGASTAGQFADWFNKQI